ncbi:MAG: MptD family putative ECF transporter S component [Eggerthellaceae bacterium]
MATTTVAASSGGANAKGQAGGKDYITLAIFGVLLFRVHGVRDGAGAMNANLFWFTHACGSLIGGIVWMYVAAKVPKRGAFAIMSAIVAVVALPLGMLDRPGGHRGARPAGRARGGAGSKRTTPLPGGVRGVDAVLLDGPGVDDLPSGRPTCRSWSIPA